MNLRRFAPLALAAGAAAACSDSGPTFVATAPQAYVRYVNASPDSPQLVARFVDRVENMFSWDRVGFRGNSGMYIPVTAGQKQLRVFLSSTNVDSAQIVVLDTAVTLQPQTYYTFVQSGTVLPRRGSNTARVDVFADTLPVGSSIPADQMQVRVYHMAEGAPNVDVALNKSVVVPANPNATPPTAAQTTDSAVATTVANLAFRSRSAYVQVPVVRSADTLNLYRFTVRPAGGATNLLTDRPNVPGLPYQAPSVTQPELNAVAGVRQGRSVMSLFIFPAAVPGSPAAGTTPGVSLIPDQMPPRP